MIKSLYKTFQHWSSKGGIYIISDPHFEDSDMNWRINQIRTLTHRNDLNPNFIPIYIAREINRVCGKNDTLIILGDIGNVEWIKDLRARYKVLIKGNHDKGNSIYEDYFDEVYDGPLFISDKILLSHEPIYLDYVFNIHGHVHDLQLDEDPNHLNCTVERLNYKPVNLKGLISSGKIGKVDNIHRKTIDEATEKRRSKKIANSQFDPNTN